jgi:hypothetical protein
VFERVVDHLAATHEWASVTSASSAVKGKGVNTGSGSDRVKNKPTSKKKATKKAKARKTTPVQPQPDEIVSEPVKLYYLIDRRDFLDKVKSVYAAYA